MKKIIFLIVVILINNLYSQVNVSKEYSLTKVSRNYEKLEEGTKPIFLVDNFGVKHQKIDIYLETYENDGVVKIKTKSLLKNVSKIIEVEIYQCACYCDTYTYVWILTNNEKWVSLPVIEEEDYELTLMSREYVFEKNKIKLLEYKDELNNSKEIKRKSSKVIKEYIWDGESIK
ncbi:hypothetical protein H3Z83_02410 [Tenacibaculum sp. S7007]|uniref:Uncharacterized protein n=1 Tax=Tenacibaculum pelagium TaxID=2759527 RepID=A0A839AJQ8_9FLAO|nr:hypothetical protein [Tenacibaculum pelagium]MBA6155382.1 hypothetical protein [Tenacibaculum pelagium]